MKLYRIIVLHAGPKSSRRATETYLAAMNPIDVAEWIEREKNDGHWYTPEEDGEESITRNVFENGECIDIPFHDYILRNSGDLEDEEGWGDAYYGVTKWGWELVESATAADIERLIFLKIARAA